jgi:hypothetical protein
MFFFHFSTDSCSPLVRRLNQLEQQRVASARTDEAETGGAGDDAKDLHVVTSTGERAMSDRRVRVEGLVVGSTYKFRVAACNAVGRGPWSPWTPNIHVTEECVGDPLDKWG